MRRRTDALPRRGTDRAEDWVAWLLFAAGFILAVAAFLVGSATQEQMAEQARAQAADRIAVTATLPAGSMMSSGQAASGRGLATAAGTWTGPDGRPHDGVLLVAQGLPAGSRVPLWVDRTGTNVDAPLTATDAAVGGIFTGAGLFAAGLGLIVVIWCGTRRITGALNAARWEREWQRIGPEWTGHLR